MGIDPVRLTAVCLSFVMWSGAAGACEADQPPPPAVSELELADAAPRAAVPALPEPEAPATEPETAAEPQASATEPAGDTDVLPAEPRSAPPEGADTLAPPAEESRKPLDLEARVRDPDRPGLPKMFWLDVKHVVSRPFHWRGQDWLLAAATLGTAGAVATRDQEILDSTVERGPTFGTTGSVVSGLGDGRSILLTGGLIAAGAIFGDQKAKEVGVDAIFSGVIGAVLVNTTLASTVGRARPKREEGDWSFRSGFNTHPGYRSFPSGHTVHAFSVSSAIAASYDQFWVKAAAYGAATMAGYLRLRNEKHWLSDVIVGAAIGTAVGNTVVRLNRRLRYGEDEPERGGARLTVFPVVHERAFGFSATLDF